MVLGSEDEEKFNIHHDAAKMTAIELLENKTLNITEPSNDQKEKLKIKLLQESQIYYENNMN